jgi:hypothetical protein
VGFGSDVGGVTVSAGWALNALWTSGALGSVCSSRTVGPCRTLWTSRTRCSISTSWPLRSGLTLRALRPNPASGNGLSQPSDVVDRVPIRAGSIWESLV